MKSLTEIKTSKNSQKDEFSTMVNNEASWIDSTANIEQTSKKVRTWATLTKTDCKTLNNKKKLIKEPNEKGTLEKKKDLSSRFDVVFKTLARAMKRYYSAELGASTTIHYKINTPETIELWKKIDEVSRDLRTLQQIISIIK